jgi:hypothetical protein
VEDISLHILDIVENSLEAGASYVTVSVVEDSERDILSLEITDNGHGMSPESAAAVLDPFYTTRTTRRVGLGLSLLAQSARETGGDIEVRSTVGAGTSVRAWFVYSHVDRKPLGDIASTYAVLIAGHPANDFVLAFTKDGDRVVLDTRLVRNELGGIPLNHPEVIGFIRAYLKEHFPSDS